MQLTQFTDFALRTLIYLAHHPPIEDERLPAVLDISRAYSISTNHLSKVARLLVQAGFLKATRGRNGGLMLALPPEQINLGQVVRKTESSFDLVECFDLRTNTCPIVGACALKAVLADARYQFLAVLDGKTLADIMGQPQKLFPLWKTRRGQPQQEPK
jgi:Rrf2 family nitric oxide-sensitive transcriptional repressor